MAVERNADAGGDKDRSPQDLDSEELRELVDGMEEDIEAERRESGVAGHIGERSEVEPVEPDDQAPS